MKESRANGNSKGDRLKNQLTRDRKINRSSINSTLEKRNINTQGRYVAGQMWLSKRLMQYWTTLTEIWHSNMEVSTFLHSGLIPI